MRKKNILACILGTYLCINPAWAFDAFVVESIRIEGLQRVSEPTVYNYLPFEIGDTLTQSQSDDIIRALFKTGFFQDIQISRDQNALVLHIVERPVIGKITISGNKEIKSKELLVSLKEAGLTEGRTFDRSLLVKIRNELERIYFSYAKYGVEIAVEVVDAPRNRVAIDIVVREGDAARIADINILGANDFSQKNLLEQLSLSKTNWLSWMNKDDRYDKHRLEADLERLQAFYMDRGYLNFQITGTQVSMTPDKKHIYLTIPIEEGAVYRIASVTLDGAFIVPKAELEALITTKPGDVFSRQVLTQMTKAMVDRMGAEGYVFAQVIPVPVINEKDHTVAMTLTMKPAHQYYVHQILFTGNHRTKDNVLRREMTQLEGAVVSTVKVEESKTRLDKTGFFQEVVVETQAVEGSTDQLDVVYKVEEAVLGSLSGGVGYSSAEGIIFNVTASNRNIMGTGNSLDLDFNRSKTHSVYNLGYNNPYYTNYGVSRGFNLYYSETDPSRTSDVSDYIVDTVGGYMHYGIPVSPLARLTAGVGLRSTYLKLGSTTSDEIAGFVSKYGNSYKEVNLSISWSYNSLDRYIFPTTGWRQNFGFTSTAPGSDLQYYRVNYNTHWFHPLAQAFVLSMSGSTGYGAGYGKTRSLPFYEHYFVGGSRTLRGYEENSVGPLDSLGNAYGGSFMVAGTTQLALRSFMGEPFKVIRPAIFLDVGQVYSMAKQTYTAAGLPIAQHNPQGIRLSTGAALTWQSPMGPLEFSLGFPLNAKAEDKTTPFSFSFGTFF